VGCSWRKPVINYGCSGVSHVVSDRLRDRARQSAIRAERAWRARQSTPDRATRRAEEERRGHAFRPRATTKWARSTARSALSELGERGNQHSAPDGTRTHTGAGLSRLPLPFGLRGPVTPAGVILMLVSQQLSEMPPHSAWQSHRPASLGFPRAVWRDPRWQCGHR
jgi:hypothetical protein